MTPREVYEMAVVETETAEELNGCYYNHAPEIAALRINWAAVDATKRLDLRVHALGRVDIRRYHRLMSVWFDGSPVMMCQNAGREGDDYHRRWVTDVPGYLRMLHFLATFAEPDPCDAVECTPDGDIGDVLTFYGKTLKPGVQNSTEW